MTGDFECLPVGTAARLRAQTALVDRLCNALDAAGEGVGHESVPDLLRELGPENERCLALLEKVTI